MEFRKIFDALPYDEGKSSLTDRDADFATAAAKALDTLPVDQRPILQAACDAAKTLNDLPTELQAIVKPYMP